MWNPPLEWVLVKLDHRFRWFRENSRWAGRVQGTILYVLPTVSHVLAIPRVSEYQYVSFSSLPGNMPFSATGRYVGPTCRFWLVGWIIKTSMYSHPFRYLGNHVKKMVASQVGSTQLPTSITCCELWLEHEVDLCFVKPLRVSCYSC